MAQETNTSLVNQFYAAFSKGDYKTMQACYHPDARFSDPVFADLNVEEVKAMWEMLLTSATDLKVTYADVEGNDNYGSAHWEAWYTFSLTGKKVHNIIEAKFEFKDGKIIRHRDHFDFWRWSRMALGWRGWVLGWSPLVQNKVRATAKYRLAKFVEKKRA